MNKNMIQINKFENRVYYTKHGKIVDKICPQCQKILFHNEKICSCGFFVELSDNTFRYSAYLLLGILIGVLFLFALSNIKIPDLADKKLNLEGVSPTKIQVLSNIDNPKARDYISNIYVKPKKENELVILIKPYIWNTIPESEKVDLLKTVEQKWTIIYENRHPTSDKTPTVSFANL